jgi:hypothetical protein
MLYGGNGHTLAGGYGPECDFMYPGLSDPYHWGTGFVPPNGPVEWTEETAGNQPSGRRFLMAAGPFTLESGGVNYVTMGVPWAQASSGGAKASLEKLRVVDDKVRRLFNHSIIVNMLRGPDAPDLVVRELDKELILFLVNRKHYENYPEDYKEWDPSIVFPGDQCPIAVSGATRLYRFEGYQIFQLAGWIRYPGRHSMTGDADKARLVGQCDLKNDIDRIINWEYDDYLGLDIPREKVSGANEGLFHSIRVTEDLFATGDRRLVNNRTYYFMAFSYAHNEFAPYRIDAGNPEEMNGQKRPYLAGRRSQSGGAVVAVGAIPHIPAPLAGGTKVNAKYGDGPAITRIEGHGNGGMVLELTRESVDEIMSGSPHVGDKSHLHAGPGAGQREGD